jgi:hypothetical protein
MKGRNKSIMASNVRSTAIHANVARKARVVCVLAGTLMFSSHLFAPPACEAMQVQPASPAQKQTSALRGTLSDIQGKTVAAATVIIENQVTHEQFKISSGSDGTFAFEGIPSGQYGLHATKDGYKEFVIRTMPLMPGDVARAVLQLEPGLSTDITYGSGTSVTSNVGTALASKEITEIPENQRNFVNIAQLASGANEGTTNTSSSGALPGNQHDSSSVSVGGQSESFNNQMIDGVDNNFTPTSVLAVHPTVDTIASLQVMSNAYNAAYGRAFGGVVNLTTKSGGSKFHGTLYEFFRNDDLDANPYLYGAQTRKPEVRQNQFGGSLSGPLYKKILFYADYEGFRLIQGIAPTTYLVPTAYEQDHIGDFSDIGGPVLTASQIDPAGKDYFMLYPRPNTGGSTGNEYVAAHSGSNFTNMGDMRVDDNLTSKDQFFGRFSYNSTTTVVPPTFPAVTIGGMSISSTAGREGVGTVVAWNAVLSLTHTFTSNLAVNLKAGYTVYQQHQGAQNTGKNVNALFGMPNVNFDATTTGLAPVTVSTGTAVGNSGSRRPSDQDEDNFNYKGEVSWTKGAHQMYFGAGLVRRLWLDQGGDSALGAWTFANYPSLLEGTFTAVNRSMYLVVPHYNLWETNVYAEDHWRVGSKLTISYGLRYDVFTQPIEQKNRMANFDATTGKIVVAGVNGASTTVGVETDYSRVQPRIGFVYEINSKTTVRSGYGMSVSPQALNGQFSMDPFVYSFGVCSSTTCPAAYQKLSDGLPAPATPDYTQPTGNILYAREKDYRDMRIQQWNVAIDRQLSNADMLRLVYAGSVGDHVTQDIPDINAPLPNTSATPNTLRPFYSTDPNLTSVGFYRGHAVTSYNAFQSTYTHSTKYGLNATFNYTFARDLDDARTIGDTSGYGTVPGEIRSLDYGNSEYDIRHHLNSTIMYKLPFGQHAQGVKKLLENRWQTNITEVWGTGLPFTVVNASDVSGTNPGAAAADRPNVNGKVALSNPGIKKFFNTAAFSAQTPGTLGDESRYQYYGPHIRHTDVALQKDFDVIDKLTGQFRAECFNITNTANYAAPVATLGSGNFGKLNAITRGYTPRELQFVLKLNF